jgi:rSAM/selenodomain-associated transferase 1
MTKARGTLVVFARAPERGRVKTRLAATVGEDAALALYRAFLDDACALAAEVAERRVLAVAGEPATLDEVARRYAMRVVRQEGADLGARMDHAISTALAIDDGPVCIIGSDSPSLPASLVREAFGRLSDHEVAIGPSGDGGYWLIGARRPVPELFRDVAWGTPAVLAETLRRVERAALLPFWYDVDEPRDLQLLEAHLRHLPATAASATRAALARTGALGYCRTQ